MDQKQKRFFKLNLHAECFNFTYKPFDKVNHNILIKKVINHKIKAKIGTRIKDFLQDRKYKVVANGEISEKQEVI